MSPRIGSVIGASAAAVLLLAVGACVDEKKVEVERPFFQQPPAAAAGFLGYTDTTKDNKKTACGNCHVAHAADWAETKHAHAWLDMKSSSHAAESCEACHSVSQLGNAAASANVAYTSTKDPRYVDVQCESCHGSGLEHALAPDGTTKPLASIAADTGAAGKTGCTGCHSGTHDPFAEEWRPSKHGILEVHAATSTSTTGKCVNCHTGQGWLVRQGVTAHYQEMGNTGANSAAITCAVCHDPHSDKNAAQTRLAINVADTTKNLCMTCHMRESEADPANTRGPHSPEGPTLLGEAGWFGPDFTFKPGDLRGTHATGDMCVTCHMSTASFASDTKGNLNVGHTFQATPCVDASGKFVGGDCTDDQRSFKACTASGCHGSEAAARSAYATGELRINTLVAEANRLIALVPASEFKAPDTIVTVGEGAKFNVQVAQKPGAVVHNPFLTEALLTSSISALKKQYKLTSTPGFPLMNVLRAQGK
jgi:predicted CXXCH cytochrome family protein